MIVGVSLLVSLLTLLLDDEDLVGVVLGPGDRGARASSRTKSAALGGPLLMVAPTVALIAISLAIAFAAGPLYTLAERAATDLLDPAVYERAVLG